MCYGMNFMNMLSGYGTCGMGYGMGMGCGNYGMNVGFMLANLFAGTNTGVYVNDYTGYSDACDNGGSWWTRTGRPLLDMGLFAATCWGIGKGISAWQNHRAEKQANAPENKLNEVNTKILAELDKISGANEGNYKTFLAAAKGQVNEQQKIMNSVTDYTEEKTFVTTSYDYTKTTVTAEKNTLQGKLDTELQKAQTDQDQTLITNLRNQIATKNQALQDNETHLTTAKEKIKKYEDAKAERDKQQAEVDRLTPIVARLDELKAQKAEIQKEIDAQKANEIYDEADGTKASRRDYTDVMTLTDDGDGGVTVQRVQENGKDKEITVKHLHDLIKKYAECPSADQTEKNRLGRGFIQVYENAVSEYGIQFGRGEATTFDRALAQIKKELGLSK